MLKAPSSRAISLAAKGLQREVDKVNATVKTAEKIGFGRQMEALISRLARL